MDKSHIASLDVVSELSKNKGKQVYLISNRTQRDCSTVLTNREMESESVLYPSSETQRKASQKIWGKI